ncbi:MAG: addiction module antidote protein, HigA family [Achromobacter sp.]|nr:addiction module antidote protein, HigA family [Achromobacter sp.]
MMHNPPHPSEILREDLIATLDLSVTETADWLAMSRVALSRALNGKAGISPALAVRLEQAGASTAQASVVAVDLMRVASRTHVSSVAPACTSCPSMSASFRVRSLWMGAI